MIQDIGIDKETFFELMNDPAASGRGIKQPFFN